MGAGTLFEDLDVPSLWAAIEIAAEIAQLAIYICRVDTTPPRIVYTSKRAQEITGRSAAELDGGLPWSILREADWPHVRAAVSRPPGAPPLAFDVVVKRADGKEIPIELASTRIHAGGGIYAFGVFRDVSVERAAVVALRASEARFRFLVESAPDGVVILKRGAIAFINPRAAVLLGAGTPEQALGKMVNTFLPAEEAKRTSDNIAALFAGGQLPPHQYRTLADPHRIVEIKSVLCDWEGERAVLAFARDVTERRAIEQKLVDADRLAAMGTLAAGVAHEINNPLTYALLGAQRIEVLLSDPGIPAAAATAIRERLHEIEHGIQRVASITQGLRSFARPDDSGVGAVDITAVLDRAVRMVDNDLRHRAQLVREHADVPPISGNAARLEQVFVNVLLNAIQALPADGAQTITIAIAPRADSHVTVSVSDTGRGISPEVRGKIFDPFFTTRRIGEGMGLGLSVCKTIVEGFGGAIEVTSQPGAGTTMTIVLPVHRGRSAAAVEEQAPALTAGVRRRVLIIDDERLVRDALARILAYEHDVISAASGEAGLAALAAGPVDAILCDVMMPGMNGREVHRRIAATHPGLEKRIVFISGGTFTPELDEFLLTTANQCLGKPFKLADVLAAVEATCADSGSAL